MEDTRKSEKSIIESIDPISSKQIHKIVSILVARLNESSDDAEKKEIEDILQHFVLIDDKGTAAIF